MRNLDMSMQLKFSTMPSLAFKIIKRRSQTFFNMIYREDSSYIVNEEKNELNEISAYFRSVMESAELNYAVQLSVELEQIKQKKHMAETNLSANDEISMLNQELMEAAHSQQVKVWDKLRLIHSCWLNRFRQHPEWFIQHYYRIRTLPAPILEIKMEIEKYMNGQKILDLKRTSSNFYRVRFICASI